MRKREFFQDRLACGRSDARAYFGRSQQSGNPLHKFFEPVGGDEPTIPPCSITSSIPCPRQAITGLAQDMASRYTHPKPSLRLGNTNMEQRRMASATSERLFRPSN